MRIAAVVLNYRSPDLTLEAVHALGSSRRALDEVIIVDNGSSDGSEQRLRRACPGVQLVQTGANLGFSGGCNAGIRLALEHGVDGVLLVNSDALVTDTCVGLLEEGLAAHPKWGIVGPSLLSSDRLHSIESLGISYSSLTGRMQHRGFGRPSERLTLGDSRTVDAVSGCVMLIRRSTLERVGLLTEDYFFSFEDLDFCLRARATGALTGCIENAVAHHRGAHTIGRSNPRRLYFASRNHLLLAQRTRPLPPLLALARGSAIVALNLAHATVRSRVPLLPGLRAVTSGVRDHLRGRYFDPTT